MQYSKELIKEVKELYPDYKEIWKLADEGSTFLGRYLDDGSHGSIAVDTILLATSLDELQKIARIAKRKKELYSKWCKEHYPQNQ